MEIAAGGAILRPDIRFCHASHDRRKSLDLPQFANILKILQARRRERNGGAAVSIRADNRPPVAYRGN
jgi:hypothetical protein